MGTIKIYKGNTAPIKAVITKGPVDLNTYTAHLVAKKSVKDTEYVINEISSIDASTALFDMSKIDTSLNGNNYIYEFYIDTSTKLYTVDTGEMIIVNTVRG